MLSRLGVGEAEHIGCMVVLLGGQQQQLVLLRAFSSGTCCSLPALTGVRGSKMVSPVSLPASGPSPSKLMLVQCLKTGETPCPKSDPSPRRRGRFCGLTSAQLWCSQDPNLAPNRFYSRLIIWKSSVFAGYFHEISAALKIQHTAFIVD